MPTIDFYLVAESTVASCYGFICKLIDKGYLQKRSIYVHTNSSTEAATLDDLLWIFRDDAFIPHGVVGATTENIQIGWDLKVTPTNPKDILINLTIGIPALFNQFQRVLEVVPQDLKKQGREKYKMYREHNCEITTHDLTKNG